MPEGAEFADLIAAFDRVDGETSGEGLMLQGGSRGSSRFLPAVTGDAETRVDKLKGLTGDVEAREDVVPAELAARERPEAQAQPEEPNS